jgi:hypothetical protein
MSINWRSSGDVDLATWTAAIPIASEIRQAGEVADCWQAARPYSRLCLGQMAAESSFATDFAGDPASNKNALNLRPRGGLPGFQAFSSWQAGIAEWRDRITSSTYAYKDTQTVADLVAIYAPSSDSNNVAAYVATVETIIARLTPAPGGNPVTLNMTKGLIPMPPIADDFIDVSARDQSLACRGYDMLGNRPEIPKFLVLHRSQCDRGSSNSGYFHQRCCPALTDLEVDCDTGAMRRYVRRGNAPSGWANGVVNAPYGDALAWLTLSAVNGDLNTVNRDGESIEITGWFLQPGAASHEDPVADPCWESLARWFAARGHDYGITYLDWPIIPSEGGRSYLTWHQEWTIGTGKVCPGKTVMDGTNALVERARAIMKAAQTAGATPVPTPTPVPVPAPTPVPVPAPAPNPAVAYVSGMDAGIAAELFGSVGTWHYVENGTLSNLWLDHGKATGSWPRLVDVKLAVDSPTITRTYFIFSSGVVWWRPNDKAPVVPLKAA